VDLENRFSFKKKEFVFLPRIKKKHYVSKKHNYFFQRFFKIFFRNAGFSCISGVFYKKTVQIEKERFVISGNSA